MKSTTAQRWEIKLGKQIRQSISRALLHPNNVDQAKVYGGQWHLDRLILLLEIIRFVLLPQWLPTKTWSKLNHEASVHLLMDQQFMGWLRSAQFLHAAKDPMNLSRALTPTGRAVITDLHYSTMAPNAPVPDAILELLWSEGQINAMRRLARRPRFDPLVHGIGESFQVMSAKAWYASDAPDFEPIFAEEDSSQVRRRAWEF